MADFSAKAPELIMAFIKDSRDGYGIFCADDTLMYGNYAYLDIFCLSERDAMGKNFEFMVRHAFREKRGINIEADDIEQWLDRVHNVRRQSSFRIFEVDLVDGRWLLFSEQILPSGELLVQTKDITRLKVTESRLEHSVKTLHKLALTDELTQLANRRSFVDSVESEISRCRRADCDSSIALLLIDLDHFKQVNDNYGHHAGDAALVHTADVLKKALREYDIVGRIGGEEFAVFLGTTEVDKAIEVAERVLTSLAGSQLNYQSEPIQLTASIGLTARNCTATFEQLYTEADDALYLAKGRGRNRVEVYSDSVSPR